MVQRANNIGIPNKHIQKEKAKIAIATQAIANGVEGSTTNKISKLYPNTALNTGSYTQDDIVYVSSNGNRKGRIIPFTRKGKFGKGPINKTVGDSIYVNNISNAVKAHASIVVDSDEHLNLKGKDKNTFDYGKYGTKRYKDKNGKWVNAHGEFNRGEWDIDEWMTKYADGYIKQDIIVNNVTIGIWIHAATHGDAINVYEDMQQAEEIRTNREQRRKEIETAFKELKTYVPITLKKVEYANQSYSIFQLLKDIYSGSAFLGQYYDGVVSVVDFKYHMDRLNKIKDNDKFKERVEKALSENKERIENIIKKTESNDTDKDYIKNLNNELKFIDKLLIEMNKSNSDYFNLIKIREAMNKSTEKLSKKEAFNATLLHEMIHGLIDDWLSSASEKELEPLKALYNEALTKYTDNSSMANNYWRQDLHEFVAEMISNKTLLTELNKIQSDSGHKLGNKFYLIIKNILNKIFKNFNIEFNEGSISSEVMIQLDKVMTNTEKANIKTANMLLEDIANMVKDC